MKRIANITVAVIFLCLMITFCAASVTTFANEHADEKHEKPHHDKGHQGEGHQGHDH